MWAGGLAPAEQNKGRLVELGISDRYPFPASIASLTYTTENPAEIPTLAYSRPYADDAFYTLLCMKTVVCSLR